MSSPVIGRKYTHTNGSTYSIKMFTNTQPNSNNGIPTVVYKSINSSHMESMPIKDWCKYFTLVQ